MMNETVAFEEERVIFAPDLDHDNRYLPSILTTKKSGLQVTRKFVATDMIRVLDYEEVSGGRVVAVRDETMMVGDYVGDGTSQISFPPLHVVLRGGFLFCFNEDDVEEGEGTRYTTYESPPVAVVPLDHVEIQFPPGGRRVFREHAHTAASTGYEMVILHNPPEDSDMEHRPPAFLVMDSLGKRNKWAEAMKARSKLNKHTMLRAGYSHVTSDTAAISEDPMSQVNKTERSRDIQQNNTSQQSSNDEMLTMGQQEDRAKTVKPFQTSITSNRTRGREAKTLEKKILDVADDAELAGAVAEFGVTEFDEKEWMNKYFVSHLDVDAAATCEQMENWLLNMKKSLKGAVLEQYEYFVQASGEMTTMGREVASLKMRIETQVELLKEMKEIDILGALKEEEKDTGDEIMGRDNEDFNEDVANGSKDTDFDFGDELGEMMKKHRGYDANAQNGITKDKDNNTTAPPIPVPDWLEDVDEEINATVKECRYNAAIDLYLKATNEITDLLDKHERPTAYRLTDMQLQKLRSLRRTLKAISNHIGGRLEESLQRKNEALRQAVKRERTETKEAYAPLVSPCAINDDILYLQLLVRLGRTQQAANAFAGRRSLLLLETLQESPMSGAGTIDLVIYAAQLSQSFFSCLASSVEGFLDLFLMSIPHPTVNGDKSEDSDASSLHSHSLGDATKNLPAGAVSALVLWCDSELSKFAIAFGGSRVLSNLALSPPKGIGAPKGPRVVGDDANGIDGSKERKNSIEVAAQCVDQAFLYASQNLDSVGLPLTPRLAEMVRVRLKGCEQEVSLLLDERWHNLTQDWRTGGGISSGYNEV